MDGQEGMGGRWGGVGWIAGEVWEAPVTSAVVCACCAVHLLVPNERHLASLALSLDTFLNPNTNLAPGNQSPSLSASSNATSPAASSSSSGATPLSPLRWQWHRVLTSAMTHANMLHLVFNIMSLWNLRYLERAVGPAEYLRWSTILVGGSAAALLSLNAILARVFPDRLPPFDRRLTVGYSGVVFGLMTIYATRWGGSYNILGFHLPAQLTPFASLILTSLIIPNASFLGHLSGIAVGYLIAYHRLDWFNNYALLFSVFGYLGLCVTSGSLEGLLGQRFAFLSRQTSNHAARRKPVVKNGVLTWETAVDEEEVLP